MVGVRVGEGVRVGVAVGLIVGVGLSLGVGVMVGVVVGVGVGAGFRVKDMGPWEMLSSVPTFLRLTFRKAAPAGRLDVVLATRPPFQVPFSGVRVGKFVQAVVSDNQSVQFTEFVLQVWPSPKSEADAPNLAFK